MGVRAKILKPEKDDVVLIGMSFIRDGKVISTKQVDFRAFTAAFMLSKDDAVLSKMLDNVQDNDIASIEPPTPGQLQVLSNHLCVVFEMARHLCEMNGLMNQVVDPPDGSFSVGDVPGAE